MKKKILKWTKIKAELPKDYAKQMASLIAEEFGNHPDKMRVSGFQELTARQIIRVFTGETTDINKVATVKHFSAVLRQKIDELAEPIKRSRKIYKP